MLMQTNSYIVAQDKREEHSRLMRRFRQALLRLGCEHFEVFEQVNSSFASSKGNCRFVQVMRFRDRRHYHAMQEAERNDEGAQELIRELCRLVDLECQREQSSFVADHYASLITGGGQVVPSSDDQPQGEGGEVGGGDKGKADEPKPSEP